MSEFETNPEAKEAGEATKARVYRIISELRPVRKAPYTAVELFEQNKFELGEEQLETIYGIYAFDEETAKQKPTRSEIIEFLRTELQKNDEIYQTTVEDSDKIEDYSYPDLLTDATTIKGEKIKQVLIRELVAADDVEGIMTRLVENIEMMAMMGEEIDAEQASALMFGEYGIPLESELIPEALQQIILTAILGAYEKAVDAMETEE